MAAAAGPAILIALGSTHTADSMPSTAQGLVCPPDQIQAQEEQLHLTRLPDTNNWQFKCTGVKYKIMSTATLFGVFESGLFLWLEKNVIW